MRVVVWIVVVASILSVVFNTTNKPHYAAAKDATTTQKEIPTDKTVLDQLPQKTGKERAEIKAEVVSRLATADIFQDPTYGYDIQIVSTTPLEKDGVEILARAWKNGKPIGFGKDGTIETERFRIYNPPLLVDDPLGDIIQSWTDEIDGIQYERRLRYDPKEALHRTIAHNIHVTGTLKATPVPGTIGHTVSTFYPDANPETSSVDGYTYDSGSGGYASVHDNTTADDATDTGTSQTLRNNFTGGTSYEILRMIFVFNTASIPDSDTINSATLSLYPSAAGSTANSDSVVIVSSAPASNTALATGDYDSYGTTAFATAIAMGSWSTGAYKNFALNASGISQISKTATSPFGARTEKDRANTTPTGSNTAGVYFAEQAGTSNDPKLVVDHSAAAVSTPDNGLIIFE